jgi:hypothetical protein
MNRSTLQQISPPSGAAGTVPKLHTGPNHAIHLTTAVPTWSDGWAGPHEMACLWGKGWVNNQFWVILGVAYRQSHIFSQETSLKCRSWPPLKACGPQNSGNRRTSAKFHRENRWRLGSVNVSSSWEIKAVSGFHVSLSELFWPNYPNRHRLATWNGIQFGEVLFTGPDDLLRCQDSVNWCLSSWPCS